LEDIRAEGGCEYLVSEFARNNGIEYDQKEEEDPIPSDPELQQIFDGWGSTNWAKEC